MSTSTSAASLLAQGAATNLAAMRGYGAGQPGAAPSTAAIGATAGTTQGQAGAAQALPGAAQGQQQAEAFSAPMLKLGAHPTLRGTLQALGVAMAHPSVNETSAQLLKQFHDQLFEMYKANISIWTR